MPKYILNIDGLYWRVKIRINLEKTVNKCFRYDHRDKNPALLDAIDWRDAMLKKHDLLSRLDFDHSPNVQRHLKRNQYIGVYECARNWSARISIDGQEIKRHFSKNYYGYAAAYAMACQVRKEYCGKLILA